MTVLGVLFAVFGSISPLCPHLPVMRAACCAWVTTDLLLVLCRPGLMILLQATRPRTDLSEQ